MRKQSKSEDETSGSNGAPEDRSALPLIELAVDGIAYGGKGIARVDGKVFFVNDAVPGDRVSARIVKDDTRYAEADTETLLTPSPFREPPACKKAAECGGCQWMGVPYEKQLEWKKSFVVSALTRIAKLPPGFDVATFGAPAVTDYRNRVLLRLRWSPERGAELGYFKRHSRDLVPIETCPIAAPPLNKIITALNALDLRTLPQFKARIELQELDTANEASEPSVVVTIFHADGPESASKSLSEKIAKIPGVAWAGQVFELENAPLFPFDQQFGIDFHTRPGQFQQINVPMNRVMRRLVKERADALSPRRILDVFCGSGNLSLPLAGPGRTVEGVEANRHAIAVAKHNVTANGLNGMVYVSGDAERHLWNCERSGQKFDLVILDPPRQGMHAGMVPLKNIAPQSIMYVSCDPTTLARDLGHLLRQDTYRLREVMALDFFPNTYHVETLAILEKA